MFRRSENRVVGVVAAVLVGLLVGMWVGPLRRGNSGSGGMEVEAGPVMPPQSLGSLSDAFAKVAEAVTPAVVNINTTRIIRRQGLFNDPFFEHFFGGSGMLEPREEERRPQSLGSGVLISKAGRVVTTGHVVEGANEITVVVPGKGEYPAKLLGSDTATDVAVVRIDGKNLPSVEWGDSDRLRVGEWVVAIGSPFGLSQTVTAGIVSAKGRADVGISGYEDFIQTDAAINPGNSGGALVNVAGELIGINTAIFSESGGYDGIGFAIPAGLAKRIAEDLIRDGQVTRGFVGILVRTITDRLAARLGLPRAAGVLVSNLYRNSPAEAAGLLPGDAITEFNGIKVETPSALRKLVSDARLGSKASLTRYRAGKLATVQVEIIKQPMDSRSGRPLPGI